MATSDGPVPRLVASLLPILLICPACRCNAPAQAPSEQEIAEAPDAVEEVHPPTVPTSGTRVVMLGTGTPNPVPHRSGPATAVVSGGRAYLVDCGPGVVRRAEAAYLKGVPELASDRLDRLFITHLHSDHTAGYPDVILTPWVVGRKQVLKVFGPPGLDHMTEHVVKAWSEDLQIRSRGKQPSRGFGVQPSEVEPGPVYQDNIVKVTAFAVKHGDWEHAYGYRFETQDRTIVISGDTTPTQSVVDACDGCDVLVHEVYALAGFVHRPPDWQAYHQSYHTSSKELARIATQARPGLLVLYHQLLWGATEQQLLQEIRSGYDGEVVYGNDLDIF